MTDIPAKEKLILDYEVRQAEKLAAEVVFKPPLTVWYILIPVIFVYYFYRLKRYADSRRDFVRHYMASRRSAVAAAAAAIMSGGKPDIDEITARSRVPAEASSAYRDWIGVLSGHYVDLMAAPGSDFDSLVRSAYRNRSNYLLFLNRLNQTEKVLDQALAPVLSPEHPAVNETIALIEKHVEVMRRAEASRVFP